MNNDAFPENDIAYIRGQYHVIRALEVAAVGRHNIILYGSPGVGKAVLARTFPTLFPVETAMYQLQPGDEEIPKQGVIFLPDIHLWKVRDLTRVWQARRTTRQQVIGTFQRCPCGYYGDPLIECSCPAQAIFHHLQSKAPFLHDFAIHVEVPLLKPVELLDTRKREPSQLLRLQIEKAQRFQEQRGVQASFTTIEKAQEGLDPGAERLLQVVVSQLHMTPHSVLQMLSLARTIADLNEQEQMSMAALAEAIQYRPRFRL